MPDLEWLVDVVAHWKWWQATLLVISVVFVGALPAIIKNLGNVLNERQKNKFVHERNMKKLENQVSSQKGGKK